MQGGESPHSSTLEPSEGGNSPALGSCVGPAYLCSRGSRQGSRRAGANLPRHPHPGLPTAGHRPCHLVLGSLPWHLVVAARPLLVALTLNPSLTLTLRQLRVLEGTGSRDEDTPRGPGVPGQKPRAMALGAAVHVGHFLYFFRFPMPLDRD